jgi:hypothetical protein
MVFVIVVHFAFFLRKNGEKLQKTEKSGGKRRKVEENRGKIK